jgi:flagellin
MSDITLSAGVRQNLLSLQNTASLLSTTQQRLATGKSVNSALDNPSNFFTSQSLGNRANDLNSLLDSIGQAQQTLSAADQGITSLTSLVQSAKSLATQASQATKGTVNYTNTTGSVAIADDTTQVVSSGTVASSLGSIATSTQSSATLKAAGLANLAQGDVLTFTLGSGTTQSVTFTTGAGSGSTFHTAADLVSSLNAAFGTAATATTSGGNVTLTSADLTNDFTISGNAGGLTDARAGATSDYAASAHSLGDALTITDAANHSTTFYKVAAGTASAANQTYSDVATLVSTINGSNVHPNITASDNGGSGKLQLSATNSITVASGNAATALGIAGTADANFNSTLNSLTGNVSIQVGSNAAHTLTFGSANGQINTKAELTTALSGLTDITGGYDSSGHIQLTPQSSDNVTIGGTPGTLTSLGLNSGVTTPTGTVVTPNSTRANLQTQFNALLTQIDQLAGDSSYNGINLLNGDNLKVTFNENGSSSLTIQGVKFDSTGLGLSAISGNGFQDNHNIDSTVSKLDGALTSLRTQAAQFGSNLSTVQTRQDFTKNLINTLQTGSDNLVLADTNQEGANLLALQTRQQLSITSLSLASQSDQAILKIL